tara:strand:- start:206 stop:595 length:390 start_codon:yes stop_codon:yes gene_type:complete
MKTLLTIFTLVFAVMFSSTSFAGWTKIGTTENGNTFYVDFERIRKHGGSVYFWVLSDYLKPSKYGDLSSKVYWEGDCKLFRMMRLSASYHTQPMGEGQPSKTGVSKNQQWKYPPPNSAIETILKSVCSR